jgi:hypothetical protein
MGASLTLPVQQVWDEQAVSIYGSLALQLISMLCR